MSLARDDTGNIRELHAKASGLSHNFRDASGGPGETQTYVNSPNYHPIPYVQTGRFPTDGGKSLHQFRPQEMYVPPSSPLACPKLNERSWLMQGSGSNPYSRRMTSSDARQIESKAGSSSAPKPSLRQPPKRRKLDHPQEKSLSKYFTLPQRRASQAIPSTSTSSHPSRPTTNAIIIDAEDDTSTTNDHSRETIVLSTSSPDPMDLISPDLSYGFDQNKRSPISQFSSSLEETRNLPQDGESTLRVRNVMMGVKTRTTASSASFSRPGGDTDDARPAPTFLSRGESSAQAEASSGRGNVKKKVALYEQNKRENPPHLDLITIRQTRKNAMKPKQVCLLSLVCTTRKTE